MDFNPDELDVTSVQIRSVCRRDLEMTSHSGCLAPGSLLLGVMTHIQDMLQADTQSIEAANSIVRIISTRCRKISLELLSARLLIKYALSYSNISERCDTTDQLQIKDLDQGRTHQHVRKKIEKGEALHAEIKPFALAWKHDDSIEQWAPPLPIQLKVTQELVIKANPFLQVKESDLWASSYATALRKALCPKPKKKDKGNTDTGNNTVVGKSGEAAKSAKTATSASKASSSSSGAKACQPVAPSKDSEIGWPLLVVSLLRPSNGNQAPSVESVKWYLWIGNYRYTMSFVDFFLLDSGGDGSTSGTSGEPGSRGKHAELKYRLGQGAIDGASVFRQYADAVQHGARLRVERILLPPSCICKEVEELAPTEKTPPDDPEPSEQTDVVVATVPIETLVPTMMLTANDQVHQIATTAASTSAASKKQTKGKGKGAIKDCSTKRKHADTAAETETATGHEASQSDPLADMAAQAASELHGDVIEEDNDTDDDSDQDGGGDDSEDDDDQTFFAKSNVSRIKNAVKNGTCPPDAAIAKVSDIIKSWPQFADLTQAEREEQALIMIITGVSNQDDEMSAAIAEIQSTLSTSSDQGNASSNNSASTVQAVPPLTEDDATCAREDSAMPSSILFSEKGATKSRGPGSLPPGKDFCRAKGIYMSSAAAEAFREWSNEIMVSSQAFQFRHERCNDPIGDNLSLALLHESPQRDDEAARMMFVHWLKHKPGSARQVHLDDKGGVIFSMAWAYKPIKLHGDGSMKNTVILPDVGVPMLKVKSAERPQVGPAICRLEEILSGILQAMVEQDWCLLDWVHGQVTPRVLYVAFIKIQPNLRKQKLCVGTCQISSFDCAESR